MDPNTPPTEIKEASPTEGTEHNPGEEGTGSTTPGNIMPPSQELESSSVQDTTSATNPVKPPPKKFNYISRLWKRFNVYLLLFILLVVIAIAFTVILTVKSRDEANSNASSASSQNLSANALKQLASTGTTIGTSSQVLNVESSAVFAGTVLVRNNLEVAGSLNVSDALSLPSITVSGLSTLSQVQAQNISTSGPASIQGLLSAKNGLSVSGDGSFSGTVTAAKIVTNALQLNGSLTFTSHITAGGTIPHLAEGNALGSGGTASVSGSDTSGSITINTGGSPASGCFVTVTFTSPFASTPHVVVTPIGASAAGIQYYVTRSTTGMSICTINPAPAGESFGFDYLIFD